MTNTNPAAEPCYFALSNGMLFTWAYLLSLSKSLRMVPLPSAVLTAPHSLVWFTNLQRALSILTVHVTNKDVKHCWSQHCSLRHITHHWCPPEYWAVAHNTSSETIQPTVEYPPIRNVPSVKIVRGSEQLSLH